MIIKNMSLIQVTKMKKLSARQFEILRNLLSDEKLDIESLCYKYSISKRTLYRDLRTIRKLLKKYSLNVNTKNDSVDLIGDKKDIKKLRLDILSVKVDISPDKRKKLILAELLQIKEPLNLEYFARKFGVSIATISYDIRDLNRWLKDYNLHIITKPGFGTIISGNEGNFRKAIIDFLYENIDTQSLMGMLNQKYKVHARANYGINDYIFNIIDQKTVSIIEKCISKIESELDFDIAESSYIGLIVHLALVFKRLQAGENIKIDPKNLERLKNTDEYKYAKKIAEYLGRKLNISLPDDEIGYITIHLRGAKYRASANIYSDKEIVKLAEEIISRAEIVFGIPFAEDEILKDGLITHLGPAVYRLKTGLEIRNPLLGDIKKKYPKLFNDTSKICEFLREKSKNHLPEDEIGYIAMHFGAAIERKSKDVESFNVLVVCASGIGTSRMLQSKLQAFPQLNVIDVMSSLKVKEIENKKNVDLVISTIPLQLNSKKCITVNPLLLEDDINMIKKALNTDLIVNKSNNRSKNLEVKDVFHIAEYGRCILELIEKITVIKTDGTCSESIIDDILNSFIKKKYIFDKHSVKRRFLGKKNFGKIVLPGMGFVIYHCVAPEIRFPLIAVGKLSDDVYMKNLINESEEIHTALLMIAPESSEGIEVVGDLSAAMIENPTIVKKMNKTDDKNSIVRIITSALAGKYYLEIKREVM